LLAAVVFPWPELATAAGTLIPQPLTRSLDLAQVDEHQRLHCRHRSACLDHARLERWRGFSCLGCDGYERSTRAEIVADHEQLIALAMAVVSE
jgi:hypothetical protein